MPTEKQSDQKPSKEALSERDERVAQKVLKERSFDKGQEASK